MPHVDIELEDNKQFISNIPRIFNFDQTVKTDQTPHNVASDQDLHYLSLIQFKDTCTGSEIDLFKFLG